MSVKPRIVHACLLAVLVCAPATTAVAHTNGPAESTPHVVKLDLAAIRKATARFQDVAAAQAAPG